mmetsp:Transcript_78921/g.154347  ORF Transcript_78921/g.154347 Transcript_78921/m.154347 type:complete len:82 (+) Transcript_78921:530-775(+)
MSAQGHDSEKDSKLNETHTRHGCAIDMRFIPCEQQGQELASSAGTLIHSDSLATCYLCLHIHPCNALLTSNRDYGEFLVLL